MSPNSKILRIITQTNFQIIAYFSPPTRALHLNVLQLFVDKTTVIHLPNCSIMNLTRESCKEAFKNGISTNQIVDFLEIHSHPVVRDGVEGKAGASVVPTNIKDQLLLWEQEQDRVEILPCFKLICINNEEYDAVSEWAELCGDENGDDPPDDGHGDGDDDDDDESFLLFRLRRELSIYFKESYRESVNNFIQRARVKQQQRLVARNVE